jgi:hypothetical protein
LAPGGGDLTLSQIGFGSLANSASIRSGTLQVSAWNELVQPGSIALAAALDSVTATVAVTSLPSVVLGSILQVDSELLYVVSVNTAAKTLTVLRAALGSLAGPHSAGQTVLPLQTSTIVVPFGQNFFANRASQNFIHTAHLPDLRISAAQFFVTNSFGDSQSSQQCFTTLANGGLRTLSGGQFSMQVAGVLSAQQTAAPPLLVAASHAVRDIRASLNQAPTGYTIGIDLLQNGVRYTTLTIASATTASNVVNGASLPALTEGATLTLTTRLTKVANYTGTLYAGKDLMVTIRM